MDNELLNNQVNTIRQAFGYIKRFHNALFVIKIDSALIEHDLFPILMQDIVRLHDAGIKIALVPGTRKRIQEILTSFEIKTKTINGKRISTEESIPFIKMAAFDVSNKIMTVLSENATHAVIGNWIRARSIGVKEGIDFQSTGTIDKVDTTAIQKVLSDNMIPIFPNIGWSRTGKPYNISSNELALKISGALNAQKLFYISAADLLLPPECTIPQGIIQSEDSHIPQLTIQEAQALLEANSSLKETHNHEGYFHLIEQSCEAAKQGVQRVHIIDGRIDGMLLKEIFSNFGFGTMIYTNEHENIRPITHQDIPEVLRITAPLVSKGVLIQREYNDLLKDLENYVVYEVDTTIHGCGALKIHEETFGEIYSIAVDDTYASMGTGSGIISYLIHKAIKLKLTKLFLLTTQTTDWFLEQGFVHAEVEDLPKEKQKSYNWERKSRILMLDLTNSTILAQFSQRL